MSDTRSMKEIASEVAERLRSKITHTTHSSYPWLFVPADEVDLALVRDRWFKVVGGFRPISYRMLNMIKDKKNLESTAAMTGKSFKADSKANVVEAFFIVWTEKAGTLPHPFPSQHLVIIALEDLGQHNGLPMIEGGGTLTCGRNIVLSGDEDMRFNAKGGGLAFFIVLKL